MKTNTLIPSIMTMGIAIVLIGCAHWTVSPEARSWLDQDTSVILLADEHLTMTNFRVEKHEFPEGGSVVTARMDYDPGWDGQIGNITAPLLKLVDFCHSLGGRVPGYNARLRHVRDGSRRDPILADTFVVPGIEGRYRLCETNERPLFLYSRVFEPTINTPRGGMTYRLYLIEWPKDATKEQVARHAEILDQGRINRQGYQGHPKSRN